MGIIRKWWRSLSRTWHWVFGILAILLVIRAAMPYVVENYVNRQLDSVPDYGGRIGNVDIHLFRGAYSIHEMIITKTSGDVPVPLFKTARMDLSVEWKELIRGSIVGEVIVEEPEINFVAGPTAEQTQTGDERAWGDVLESLFPFRINRFEVRRGKVHFRNLHSAPPVDIWIGELFGTATNLTNARDLTDKLPAGVIARGETPDRGALTIDLQLDPLTTKPTFELNAALTNAELTSLNTFFRAYGGFDVERGSYSLFASAASNEGEYEGYVKLLMEDMDVFSWEKERKKNIGEIFWAAIVDVAVEVFKNHPRDQVAAKIPFSGSLDNTRVGTWAAVGSVLRNAFIRALLPRLDQPVKLEEVGDAKTQAESSRKKLKRREQPEVKQMPDSRPKPERAPPPERGTQPETTDFNPLKF